MYLLTGIGKKVTIKVYVTRSCSKNYVLTQEGGNTWRRSFGGWSSTHFQRFFVRVEFPLTWSSAEHFVVVDDAKV